MAQDAQQQRKNANPIASAITLVREQLIIVEDMIENYQSKELAHKAVNPNELKTLRTTKNEMERQIGQLLPMARTEEDESVISSSLSPSLLLSGFLNTLFLAEKSPQRCCHPCERAREEVAGYL